ELRTLGTYEEISRRIVELPHTMQKLFAWILERLENDDGFRDAAARKVGKELVSRFAALLSVSRHGLSQHELVDLLASGDPQGNVSALLHLLRPYLMRRGELLDFYHDQFRAAAKEAWLNSGIQRQAAHAELAVYFDAQPNRSEPKQAGQPPTPNARKGTELVVHQLASGRLEALRTSLCDLDFLRTAC